MKKLLILGPLFYGYSKSVAEAFEKENFEVEVLEWVENGIENFSEKLAYNFSKNKKG